MFHSLQENTLCLCIVDESAIWQMSRHNDKLVMTNQHCSKSTFQFGFAAPRACLAVILHYSQFGVLLLIPYNKGHLSHLLCTGVGARCTRCSVAEESVKNRMREKNMFDHGHVYESPLFCASSAM